MWTGSGEVNFKDVQIWRAVYIRVLIYTLYQLCVYCTKHILTKNVEFVNFIREQLGRLLCAFFCGIEQAALSLPTRIPV